MSPCSALRADSCHCLQAQADQAARELAKLRNVLDEHDSRLQALQMQLQERERALQVGCNA